MLDETFITIPASLMLPLYSPLVEIFNEKIHQMHSGGLIYYLEKNYTNPKGLKNQPEEIGPQVLTMEHLEIGFLVCLCPMALSVLVFAGERTVFAIRNFFGNKLI